MNNDWYRPAPANDELTQGDLIFDCPIVSWGSEPTVIAAGKEGEVLKDAMIVAKTDVVVMTQACDLENCKVRNVILCPHYSQIDYRLAWESEMKEKNQNPTERSWKRHYGDICDGFVWNLAVLNSWKQGDQEFSPRIVDFHYVFSAPRSFLDSILKSRGKPRPQLNPPYREHLSQAFARFFMRIGLPTPVNSQ